MSAQTLYLIYHLHKTGETCFAPGHDRDTLTRKLRQGLKRRGNPGVTYHFITGTIADALVATKDIAAAPVAI